MLFQLVSKRWLAAFVIVGLCPFLSLAGSSPDPGQMLAKMQQMKNSIQKGLQVREHKLASAETRLMKMMRPGSLSGQVIGIDEADIPTGWVMAWSAENGRDSSMGNFGFSTLEPDGSYKITGLDEGEFYVYAQADGYLSQFYQNADDATEAKPVLVTAGEITPNIDFSLKKLFDGTGAISGTVLDKATHLPVKDATITVWSPVSIHSSGYGWTSTDENGNYQILNLHAGKYQVSAWADGYKYEVYGSQGSDSSSWTPVLVTDANTTENINFNLVKTASISGRVTTSTGSLLKWAGVYASTDAGSPGDSIKPMNPVYGGYTYTDENGFYTIDNLTDGTYTVMAESWTRWGSVTEWYKESSTREGATTLNLENGSHVTGIDFTLDLPVFSGSISGKVIHSNGIGIPNASVVVYTPFSSDSSDVRMPPMAQNYKFYTTTDSEGNYSVSEIPDGNYYIRVDTYTAWSYTPTWYPSVSSEKLATLVSVKGGAPVSGADILVTSSQTTGTLSGTVKNSDGSPLSGAYVMLSSDYRGGWKDGSGHHQGHREGDPAGNHGDSLYWNPIWASAISDSAGHYTIGSLPKGSYLLQAYYYNSIDGKAASIWYNQAESPETATQIDITGDQTVTGIDFILTPKSFYGSLTGTVKNDNGEVIPNAYVELIPYWEAANPSDKFMGRWNLNTSTDENGKFSFTHLYEGQYTLVVYANGGYVYYPSGVTLKEAEPVSVAADQNLDLSVSITFRKVGTGSISGIFSSDFETFAAISGVVIAKPVISIQSYPESERVFTGVAKDGSYTIPDLPAGEFFLYAFSGMALGEYYNNVYDPALAAKVLVTNGKETTGIDFVLSLPFCGNDGPGKDSLDYLTGGRVYGKVKDTNNNLLGDVTVNLLDANGTVLSSVKSNSKGYYELSGLPSGNYSVKASSLGMEMVTNTQPMTLNKENVQLDLVMKTAGAPTQVDGKPSVPSAIQLVSVYPNPFNPETTLSFKLPAAGNVTVQIYNMLGQQVNLLSATSLNAGLNQIRWNGSSFNGTPVSSGVYLFRILAGNQVTTGKMMLAK